MVHYLQEHKGRVSVAKDSEMVLFEDDASAATMNEIFERLEAAGSALEAVTDRQASHESAIIAKMNSDLKKEGK